MTKIEQLHAAAQSLSDEQLEALVSIAKTMTSRPFYTSAPSEALAALDQGLAEIREGHSIPGGAVFEGIDQRLKALGA